MTSQYVSPGPDSGNRKNEKSREASKYDEDFCCERDHRIPLLRHRPKVWAENPLNFTRETERMRVATSMQSFPILGQGLKVRVVESSETQIARQKYLSITLAKSPTSKASWSTNSLPFQTIDLGLSRADLCIKQQQILDLRVLHGSNRALITMSASIRDFRYSRSLTSAYCLLV